MIASSRKAAPAPPRIFAGFSLSFCSMMPPPPKPTRAKTSSSTASASRVSRTSWIAGEAALARVARLGRLGGGRRGPGALLGVGALAVLAQPVATSMTHSVATVWKGWRACAQEGGELAIGDREGERRVAVLVAGDQGVDAEHPAALVEQGPARMAAGDVGGVQQGDDAVDRADVGEDADRAGRAAAA